MPRWPHSSSRWVLRLSYVSILKILTTDIDFHNGAPVDRLISTLVTKFSFFAKFLGSFKDNLLVTKIHEIKTIAGYFLSSPTYVYLARAKPWPPYSISLRTCQWTIQQPQILLPWHSLEKRVLQGNCKAMIHFYWEISRKSSKPLVTNDLIQSVQRSILESRVLALNQLLLSW